MNLQETEKVLIIKRLNKQREMQAEKRRGAETKMLQLFVQHLHRADNKKPYIQYPGKCKLRTIKTSEKTPEKSSGEPTRTP